MEVNMSMREALDFIFLKNTKDVPVHLNLWQLQDPYDLFLFLIDVVCKGLLLLFGNGEARLRFDTVTAEQLQVVTKKMLNAGIELLVKTTPLEPQIRPPAQILYIIRPNDAKNLGDFKLVMNLPTIKYEISFNLVRVGVKAVYIGHR